MNNKKTLVIASIIILSIFFILNFPIDYLACTATTTACRFFDIVKDENFQQNDSTEINDSGVELDIAFPEIEVGNLIYLTTANDESGRIFVATREGIIFYIEEDSNNISLFIDIREKIDQELTGERGLLGFTFDQNYIDNGYFYIYYILGILFTITYRYSHWFFAGTNMPFAPGPNQISSFSLGNMFSVSDLAIGFWWGFAFNHYFLDQYIWKFSKDKRLNADLKLA